jgi:hypothetical protein
MNDLRTDSVGAVAMLLSADSRSRARDGSHYRNFCLGSSLRSVAALGGVLPSDARTIHERPALMQDLEWRPAFLPEGATTTPQSDPVQKVVFSFYNDQLFRMVVDYDPLRTDGMTDGDVIAAIAAVYGPTSKPLPPEGGIGFSRLEQEFGTSLARWAVTDDYSLFLCRSPYASGFRLVVTSDRLDPLARTAAAQAAALDAREAPQRELARQKQAAEDERAAQRRTRLANKAAFKP